MLSPHPDSSRNDDASLKLFTEADCEPATQKGEMSIMAGVIAPLVIAAGVAIVKEFLIAESSRYKASYSGSASAEDFAKINCLQLTNVSPTNARKVAVFTAPIARQSNSFILGDARL